jgi:ubiquinone biosynthesis UbiH/UbiF/VisC/COQ6 family hydroxylase
MTDLHHDIIIIGAGPVGLSLAKALADMRLTVALVECASEESLVDPAFDGREIALTHSSMHIMRQLGQWAHIPQQEIFPIRAAKIMNGDARRPMLINSELAGQTQLGTFVANHLIRKAAWLALGDSQGRSGVTLYTNTRAESVRTSPQRVNVRLMSGQELVGSLLIAADSRYSETRRSMGIQANLHDFGKSMLVCRVRHEKDNEQTAWEWFGHGQTLALLSLESNLASTVITLTGEEIRRLSAAPEAEFNQEVTSRFQQRFGAMQLASSRHVYPLVGTFARRFVGTRFALVGDAAVGMHPVTAHGFNLGLASVARLWHGVRDAQEHGRDLGNMQMLLRYQRGHRQGALPLYMATRTIVELYTRDETPARWLRHAVLQAGNCLRPLRGAIAKVLVDERVPA